MKMYHKYSSTVLHCSAVLPQLVRKTPDWDSIPTQTCSTCRRFILILDRLTLKTFSHHVYKCISFVKKI